MGKSKEISQDLRKKIVDLYKSGSSLGAISKHLKLPCSSAQTIVHKYIHHGTTQLPYCSGRRRVLSPRDERTLVQKVQINPRKTAKDLVKMLEETGTKVSISTVKRNLHRHDLKGRSARKKSLLQNTKDIIPTVKHGVAASCCGGALLQEGLWCTSINGWYHEDGKLCCYIETTSQDISLEVKAWSQMVLPNGQRPQAYFQSCVKMAKSRYWSGDHKALTSIP
jgi:transposase